MGKLLSIIGYLILAFIVLTNYTSVQLSNTSVILLAIISAIFMVVGLLFKDKRK